MVNTAHSTRNEIQVATVATEYPSEKEVEIALDCTSRFAAIPIGLSAVMRLARCNGAVGHKKMAELAVGKSVTQSGYGIRWSQQSLDTQNMCATE